MQEATTQTTEEARPKVKVKPAGFAAQFQALTGELSALSVTDAVLKRPGGLTWEMMHGNRGRVCSILFGVCAASLLAYGLVMGSFSGGRLLWMSPLKLLAGSVASGLLCLPSLYIFSSMSGGKQSVAETAGLLLQALALSGILLVGFAPISWIFSQSTNALGFMGALHLVIWMVAILIGLQLLRKAFAFLNNGKLALLRFWTVLFILVSLQMNTVLRPLIGEPGEKLFQGKKFFLAHWGEALGR